MRAKRLLISPELLLEMFRGKHERGYEVIENAMPADAKVLNVMHGYPHYIELLVTSDTFPEVAPGAVIEAIAPVIRTLDYALETSST